MGYLSILTLHFTFFPPPLLHLILQQQFSHKHPSTSHLNKARQHGVPLVLIPVPKLLPQRLLLPPRPIPHVNNPRADKHHHRPAPADQDDTHPSRNLKHVIRARDQVAPDTIRDALFRSTWLAQASQVLVHNPVANLTKREQDQAEIVQGDELVTGREVARGVDVESAEEAGHDPVKGRVADDVAGGHGVGRELVDEEGLVLALEEVDVEEGEEEPLNLCDGRGGLGDVLELAGEDGVEVGTDEGDEGVEEDGAEVFDYEDGAPGYLRTFGIFVSKEG